MMRWLFALVLIVSLAFVGWVARDLLRPYQGYSGNVMVNLDPGTRAPEAARLLVSRGVLAHRLPFLMLHVLVRRRHLRIKAGEYLFDRPLRPIDVYRKLVRGDVYLHTVVIPEGSDRLDMARILHEQLGIHPPAFLRLTADAAPIHDLDPKAPSLEGYLFPDTYRFPRGVTAERVVETMLARFRQVTASRFRGGFGQPPKSLHDVITLASLVEKETPQASERPVIAGLFSRRLARGWDLQCDPTVVYAVRLGLKPGAADPAGSPITESELELDSPYNTYRHPGLPPGPICSPGEASIRAALAPAPGDSLYFVSDAHGGHVFAKTLAEHQRNVAHYRKKVAAARGPAVARSATGQRGVAGTPASATGVPKKPVARQKRHKNASHTKGKKQEGAHPRVLPDARL